MDISKEKIESQVRLYASSKIGKDFIFREYQLECIIDIIYNILTHQNHNYVVEAPTGSGKSLINLISAGVLADYYNVTSYILVSDLFLWEQYYNFLEEHRRVDIAVLKGKIGNYRCLENDKDLTLADCVLSGLTWATLFNQEKAEKYGYGECSELCPYVNTRRRALKSKACLMTYQLFIQIFKNPTDPSNPYQFKERDVIFCDECHNIPGIVEQHVHAYVRSKDLDMILEIYNYSYNSKVTIFDTNTGIDNPADWVLNTSPDKIVAEFNEIFDVLSNPESRKGEDMEMLLRYNTLLQQALTASEEIKLLLYQKKNNKEALSEIDLNIFSTVSYFYHYASEFGNYIEIIKICGEDYQLKEINKTKEDGISITFRCLKEDYLVYKYLLTKANYRVLVSATVGGHEAFDENMGFTYTADKKSEMKVIPSTFNFEQSPIHFWNKFKMSMKEKDISFEHLKTAVYSICKTKFKDQRGIIQTGSYDLAKKLYEDAPYEVKRRILLYNGSRDKNNMIKLHRDSFNTILVGPTLNEGIDLPGDQCRFIIILKVPYPSLGDKYVREKIKLYPLWYNSKTSNDIIQGIGRGIRYDGDWCVTYIFDACFWNLYINTKDQYPPELQKRINII